MGLAAVNASVEDPKQPDWMKHKSLREIEVIRETKKNEIVQEVMGQIGDGI